MSDDSLLKRIDPDGTHCEAYIARVVCSNQRDPSFRGAVEFFYERDLLRDPAEPTLAEIREKVSTFALRHVLNLAKSAPQKGAMPGERATSEDAICSVEALLALLEQRKPEPAKPYSVSQWNDTAWFIIGPAGQIARATNQHDAERVASALNETMATTADSRAFARANA